MPAKSEKIRMSDAFLLASISAYISIGFNLVGIYPIKFLWKSGLGAMTKLLGVSNSRKHLRSKVLSAYLKLSLAKKNFSAKPPPSSKNLK